MYFPVEPMGSQTTHVVDPSSLLLLRQAMDHLESFISECDRRTDLAKKRLAETQEEISAEVSAKVCPGGFRLQRVG